jgi:2-phosphosulfolactate phosphatase
MHIPIFEMINTWFKDSLISIRPNEKHEHRLGSHGVIKFNKMETRILHFTQGAEKARGLAVIIDVFRAFSLACYMADRGASRILPVGDIATAFRLKKEIPGALLVGERFERKPDGFDFGNSPKELMAANLEGKTVIHTTSAGTQGITHARQADEIITGSFVNAQAIYNYIVYRNPVIVSFVCMGYRGMEHADEDDLLAEYLSNRLKGKDSDYPSMVKKMKEGSGQRFFVSSNQSFSPEEDFYLCTRLNYFPFVLRAETWRKRLYELKRIDL